MCVKWEKSGVPYKSGHCFGGLIFDITNKILHNSRENVAMNAGRSPDTPELVGYTKSA